MTRLNLKQRRPLLTSVHAAQFSRNIRDACKHKKEWQKKNKLRTRRRNSVDHYDDVEKASSPGKAKIIKGRIREQRKCARLSRLTGNSVTPSCKLFLLKRNAKKNGCSRANFYSTNRNVTRAEKENVH